MKVKICGITNIDDELYTAELDADALGFIFVKSSPRYITPKAARKILQELPPFIVPVGIFVDVPQQEIIGVIEQTGIKCVQLHGNETPKQLAGFPVPVYKSFRVYSSFNLEILRRYKGSAYLLDTKISGKLGGTGQTFDWEIAVKAKEYGRIILAGGLNPENVLEAIRKIQPYAIDVNSGVESAPGKKDKNKLEQLFKTIRSFYNEKMK